MSEEDKTAIVLFNLGGPDKPESVRLFLYNLFSDKWIIRSPFIIRKLIAFFISTFRTKEAIHNYNFMGGKSPLLEETILQKEALEKNLKEKNIKNFDIFISMRYWHPFANEVVNKIKNIYYKNIILLPLYPQFSSSTTLSSVEEFESLLGNNKAKKICCYYDNPEFIGSHCDKIKEEIKKFKDKTNLVILFSAHSIPVKFVKQGDPYEWQINKTYQEVIKDKDISKYETILCYQSKVGPIEWLSPSTEDVIRKYSEKGKDILIVPIAFVSEHIETLVELDIQYKEIADNYGIEYRRVPALRDDKKFINCLAENVISALNSENNIICKSENKCPEEYINCLCRRS